LIPTPLQPGAIALRPDGNDLDFPCHLGYTSHRNYLPSHLKRVVARHQRRQSVTWSVFNTSLSALPSVSRHE
jgi:hypothetical protein